MINIDCGFINKLTNIRIIHTKFLFFKKSRLQPTLMQSS